jgi:antitoxin component YwqK of YwqJK toxin-antitoxin module
MKYKIIIALVFIAISAMASAQLKSFKLGDRGDTLNKIDKNNLKQGKWINAVPPLRGEPGYEEEGRYKNGNKEGIWRVYTTQGDNIAIESYFNNGKDGIQQYYSPLGALIREESWKGYNPDAPYDTIPIYGTGSGEILEMKVVKAMQYSVKHGVWKYYEPVDGRLISTEEWNWNRLVPPKKPEDIGAATGGRSETNTKKKVVPKTPEMIEWERKNKKKKIKVRTGQTGI